MIENEEETNMSLPPRSFIYFCGPESFSVQDIRVVAGIPEPENQSMADCLQEERKITIEREPDAVRHKWWALVVGWAFAASEQSKCFYFIINTPEMIVDGDMTISDFMKLRDMELHHEDDVCSVFFLTDPRAQSADQQLDFISHIVSQAQREDFKQLRAMLLSQLSS